MKRVIGDCRTCFGSGTRAKRVEDPLGHWRTSWAACPACHGSGQATIEVRGSDPLMAVGAIVGAILVGIFVAWFIVATFIRPPEARAAEPGQVGSALEAGYATWCKPTADRCHGWDVRHVGAVPGYEGRPYRARVCREDQPTRCTIVRVESVCACGHRHGKPTVVDLSVPAMRELAGDYRSRGILLVTITRLSGGPGPTLPPTDLEADVSAVALAAADTLPVWRPTAIALLVLGVMGLVAYVGYARGNER